MKYFSDDMSEMRTRPVLDDATAEALLSGAPVSPEHAQVVEVVQAIRSTANDPVEPSRQLAACMASGDFSGAPAAEPYGRRRVTGRARSMLAAMSLRARAATGVAVLFTGLSGATAAGALPDAWEEKVRIVIEAVTPVSFAERSQFGQDVADDARDGGVDGPAVSEAAREKGKRVGGSLGIKPDRGHPGNRPGGPPAGSGRPENPPGEGQRGQGRENRPDSPPGGGQGEQGRENRPDSPPGEGHGEKGRGNKPADPGEGQGEQGQENRPENSGQGNTDKPDDSGGGQDRRPKEQGKPPNQSDRPGRGY